MRKRSEVFMVKNEEKPEVCRHNIQKGNVCLHCEVEADQAKNTSDIFDSVQEPEKKSALPSWMTTIIETMVVNDFEGQFKRLSDGLKLGPEKCNDKGIIRQALDSAEDNARLANLLYLSARQEADVWKADNEPIIGQMYSDAREAIESEIDEKAKLKLARKSTITNEDVKAKAATMHPTEWARHTKELGRIAAMVDHLEELVSLWKQRCKSLEVLLGTMR